MKTILLISPYWQEEHRWMVSSVKLAELWQQMGYRVVGVCMGPYSYVDNVSDTLTVHYRRDIFLPDPLNTGIALGFFGQVRRLIKQEKPDIIVCNKILFWSSLSIIPLRLLGYRVIQLTDALVGMTWWPRGWFPQLLAVISAWTVGWLMLLCNHRFVTFHPQPEGLLKTLGIAHKTRVIPTGIDVQKFETRNSKLDTNAVTISYVGRLESIKGVEDFLAAAVPLKREYPEMNIQVVGWYKEQHPLVTQYEREVTFTGLRRDIPEVLKNTDIFVLPSYSEGLSNALMEAMSSSCACVATEVGGNRYLIQNGVSGFLYPPGDIAALQAHLRRLLDDSAKRQALGSAAHKRIEEHFDWSVVGKQYQELFDSLT